MAMPRSARKSAVSAATATAPAAKPKSKKLKIIVLVLVVLLAAGGGGAWFFLSKQRAAQAAAALGEGDDEAHAQAHDDHKPPPVFLPVDNMVVNLADPSGDRYAQIGLTFEVADEKTASTVKSYLPSIRSTILLMTSQRTAAELLQRDGKEKLAADILEEAAAAVAGKPSPSYLRAQAAKAKAEGQVDEEEEEEARPRKKKKKVAPPSGPVRGVLFSSFIIQ
jgi:flagellar FliL protein